MIYGSNGALWICPNVWFGKFRFGVAMTAIGIVGTPAGFIVAADGRMRLDDNNRESATPEMLSIESDYRQKLFQISDPQKNLAYVVTGSVFDPCGFDLLKIISTQVTHLTHRRFIECSQYVNTLSSKINDGVNSAKDKGLIDKLPEIDHVEWDSNLWKSANIIFAGYFESMASLFVVELFHSSNGESQMRVTPYPPHFCLLLGSLTIRREMYQDNGQAMPNSRFAEYIKQLGSGASLDDAQQYATGYIKACSSPLALQLDKAGCEGIGGHIHVAEITPNGFRWRIPPVASIPVTAS